MKISGQFFKLTGLLVVLLAGLVGARAQHSPPGGITEKQWAANESALLSADDPAVAAGPNHATAFRATKTGTHRIVTLADGLNFWNGKQWVASDPTLVPDRDGFSALKLQHQTHLARDLCVSNAVSVVTPDGLSLNSTPVAIGLFEPGTGAFRVIGAIKNSIGQLIATNSVVFPDCFNGVCANTFYTTAAGGFEQDVEFTGALDPSDWGFSTNSRIQIITEFYNPPTPDELERPIYVEENPAVRAEMAVPDTIDYQLGFGRFVMTQGSAYVEESDAVPNGIAAVVSKEFVVTNGRSFLVESVPYAAIAAGLKALPPCHPVVGRVKGAGTNGYAGLPHPGRRYAASGRARAGGGQPQGARGTADTARGGGGLCGQHRGRDERPDYRIPGGYDILCQCRRFLQLPGGGRRGGGFQVQTGRLHHPEQQPDVQNGPVSARGLYRRG
jgi:hypothetical protein